jgi:L-asparaginase
MQIAAPISTGLPIVPEVCICFGHLLIRGNRSRQYNSSGFTTFVSPNYAPLGKSGEQIEIDRCSIRTPKNGDFFISEKMETNVILLDVFPGMDSKILRKLFEMNPKGVVLKTLGGATKEFLDAVEEAVAKEIVVVDVTSNLSEMAKIGFYEKGGELVNRGVVSGVDMTPEAAVCKLMYLLGKGWPTAEVKRIMQLNQRGEQSRNIYEIVYEPGSADLVGTVGPKVIPDGFEKERLTNAIIRIQDVRTIGSERDIRIKAFLNLPNANKETPSSSPQCAGQIESRWEERPVNLSIDATKMTQALNPSLPISITIVAEEQGVTWKRVILSIYSRT